MEKGIILLTRIKREARQLSEFLVRRSYRVSLGEALTDQDQDWERSLVALLDLDSIAADNHIIRRLALRYPQIHFLCMSEKRLHPDLKEAMANHFYACLAKPLDFDELLYWLKCIEDNTVAGDGKENKEVGNTINVEGE